MNIDKIVELVNYEGPDRVTHFTDHLLEKAGDNTIAKNFKSNFHVFEENLGGIETGEVVIISGKTKNGKTLFAESWINSLLQMDETAKTLVLTFEVQSQKFLAKYMPNPERAIYLPMTLKTMDFQWLKERCMEAKLKFKCNLVLIDHLHFLVDMNTSQNMSLNIGAFMRRLKHEIAVGMNLAVILIAHQGQPKDGRKAGIDNIRDSSFIAQEADSVICVEREENLDDVKILDKGYVNFIAGKPDSLYKFSQNLACVSIERTRRTGCYEFKKIFQKQGEFLVELRRSSSLEF